MLPKHIIICHNKMEIGFDYILSHQTKIDGDFLKVKQLRLNNCQLNDSKTILQITVARDSRTASCYKFINQIGK
jgi:hypothetical protein